jgi:hypothetical protein
MFPGRKSPNERRDTLRFVHGLSCEFMSGATHIHLGKPNLEIA